MSDTVDQLANQIVWKSEYFRVVQHGFGSYTFESSDGKDAMGAERWKSYAIQGIDPREKAIRAFCESLLFINKPDGTTCRAMHALDNKPAK